jgi:hypothetical protein
MISVVNAIVSPTAMIDKSCPVERMIEECQRIRRRSPAISSQQLQHQHIKLNPLFLLFPISGSGFISNPVIFYHPKFDIHPRRIRTPYPNPCLSFSQQHPQYDPDDQPEKAADRSR